MFRPKAEVLSLVFFVEFCTDIPDRYTVITITQFLQAMWILSVTHTKGIWNLPSWIVTRSTLYIFFQWKKSYFFFLIFHSQSTVNALWSNIEYMGTPTPQELGSDLESFTSVK